MKTKVFDMKILLIIVVVFAVVFIGDDTVVKAAQGDCYGSPFSTREQGLSTQSRFGQQYQSPVPITLTSISLNIYADVGTTAFFSFEIQETTAGLPNGTGVAAFEQIDASTVPDGAVGIGQAFNCGSIPTIQKFTFAAPVDLNGGQMYAFVLHGTTGAGSKTNGWVQNSEGIVPLQGLTCTGAGCLTDIGWALSTFGGDNFDMWYSLETQFVDPADVGDITIDIHIDNLRKFLKLDGENGGLVFSLGVLAILIFFGMRFGIPFSIVAMMGAMFTGMLAMAGIMPGWILLAVVSVAGLGLVLKITGGKSGDENES